MNLEEIASRTEVRHEEYLRRFAALDAGQTTINGKLDSLLASRAFMRGMVKTMILYSTLVSTVVGLLIAWVKR